jgi:hypothetical protein
MHPLRNVLLEVFHHHEKRSFIAYGKTVDQELVVIENAGAGSEFTWKKVTTTALVKLIGEKVKAGYVKRSATMYFNHLNGSLSHVHTDLSWGGTHWLIAVAPRDLLGGIDLVVSQMTKAPTTLIFQEEIDAWAERQKQNSTYLVGFDDMPCWTLVLAETAMTAGWQTRVNSTMQPMPSLLPSMNPIIWAKWLQPVFELHQINEAQRLLGISLKDYISKPMAYSQDSPAQALFI